jgi:hypothetical protein
MTSAKTIPAAWIGILLIGACDDVVVHGCPLKESSTSNPYELSHELVIPTDCPVPVGTIGELKFAGATLYDDGPSNFSAARVYVTNSSGTLQNYDEQPFRGTPGVSRSARPLTAYGAATGNYVLGDNIRSDYGSFEVYNPSSSAYLYGRIEISYRQSGVYASLNGPDLPVSNTSATWTASGSGGTPPYSYQWYRDDLPVGSGPSYTVNVGTGDFGLRVEVTDQVWSTNAQVLVVDVDGVRASMSGPTLVYASQGGGTWNVDGRGGTPPYAYHWYVDDQWVGSGTSWSGYTGEHGHALRVEMHDAGGATHASALSVTGIGSGDGSCEPVPPQVSCDP